MTYGDKYDRYSYSTFNFYRDIRSKADVDSRIGRLYPNVLDHVVLDDDGVNPHILATVAESQYVDDAAASIQRFASRCFAADKSEMMVNAMSQALIDSELFPKPIIDVLLFYGAKLVPNTFNYFKQACRLGMNDVVQQAIDAGHEINRDDVRAAIVSGNCDTIKLVLGAYRESDILGYSTLLNATVQSMELCRSLNIIQHYQFSDIPSFSVLQWILDHDAMEHDVMLIDIARNASHFSGHYFDMLRYLIEQRNFTVLRDILIKIDAADLDVFDYLMLHGADVNAVLRGQNVLERFPMLIRYWIDKGFVVQSSNSLIGCIRHGMTVAVLEMMIDKYSMNVNDVDIFGYTVLHAACECNNYEVVEMLIKRGCKQTGY